MFVWLSPLCLCQYSFYCVKNLETWYLKSTTLSVWWKSDAVVNYCTFMPFLTCQMLPVPFVLQKCSVCESALIVFAALWKSVCADISSETPTQRQKYTLVSMNNTLLMWSDLVGSWKLFFLTNGTNDYTLRQLTLTPHSCMSVKFYVLYSNHFIQVNVCAKKITQNQRWTDPTDRCTWAQ